MPDCLALPLWLYEIHMKRRAFIRLGSLIGALPFIPANIHKQTTKPVVVSTWPYGQQANQASWQVLSQNGSALDSAEAGAVFAENDLNHDTIGLGGLPDRDGHVTLDACLMSGDLRAGAVVYLEKIKHPISVARAVLEKTPHIILAGDGAYQFALSQGFTRDDYTNPKTIKAWKEWLKKSEYKPAINLETHHDTIGIITLDQMGKLAGACTTSGMPFKMRGRIGDSPIIGAGLYADDEIGVASATGHGEEIIRVCGSFAVVELMRKGFSPEKACKKIVEKIYQKQRTRIKEIQACFIALNKDGEYGGFALHEGFSYAIKTNDKDEVIRAGFLE